MNLRQSLTNTFNVHPGEGWTTILLTGFSFLIGIFMSYFISLANAFYLGDFGAEYLPHGYLVTGVVGYLSGILLARLQRYLSYKKLIFSLVVLPLILTCLFRIGLWQTSSKWLSFVMFVSIGPFVTFIYFALFSLMGRLFNLRQGKRLFGLVNSGDVASSIMGFFSLPILLHFFKNSANLLWIAGGGLGLCVVVLNDVFRRFPDQLIVTHTGEEKQSSSRFLELVKRRYFVLLFLMLMATVVGFYYADYILLTSLDIRFKANKILLAQFIAIIYGLIKVVELIAKMLSGRLISQYGIGFGLMALPVLLCVFTSLGAVAGTVLGNESSIFFLMIVASKLIERVVTRSLFEPAFNILYQPLDAELRLDVQTKAEMIVQPVTVGLTGITLLIFNWFGALNLVVGVLGGVAFAWSFGSYLLYREYRQFLLQNLAQKLDQAATTSRDDISSVDLLMGKLQGGNARGAISAYRLLKRVSPASIDRLARELLTHPEPEVRQMVLEDVGQMGYVGILEDIEQQAEVEKEQQVRETALETLERLRQLGVETEPERLMELAHSPSSSDRTLAAMLLGNSEQALPVLPELLRDDHREVRKAALLAAGKTRQTDLWEKMVDHLAPPAFSNAATSALTLVGEPVLPVLAAAFSPQSRSPLALLRIAWIYGAVGGEKATAWLAQRINYSDFLVRRQVLRSLLLCGYRAQNGQSTAVNREIEEALDNALWCMAALLDVAEEHRLTRLKTMLGGEIDRNREQVFSLLSLAYDARRIMLVRDSFKSGSADAKVYALELVDMFIDSELKASLMPILDDLTMVQRLKLLELKFPQQRLAIVPRLKDIINRPYARVERWTKAGALRALADVGDQVEDELIATLFHSDELLRETAAWSLYQIDPAAYDYHVARLSKTIREGLDRVIKESQGSVDLRLMMDKVAYLKDVEAFASIPETDLIDLAEHMGQIQVQAGQVVFEGGDLGHQVYILVEGQVRLHIGDRPLGPWREKEMMGGPLAQTPEKGIATATVVERARFLVMDQDDLYNLIADHVEVASSVFNSLNPPPSDHSD